MPVCSSSKTIATTGLPRQPHQPKHYDGHGDGLRVSDSSLELWGSGLSHDFPPPPAQLTKSARRNVPYYILLGDEHLQHDDSFLRRGRIGKPWSIRPSIDCSTLCRNSYRCLQTLLSYKTSTTSTDRRPLAKLNTEQAEMG